MAKRTPKQPAKPIAKRPKLDPADAESVRESIARVHDHLMSLLERAQQDNNLVVEARVLKLLDDNNGKALSYQRTRHGMGELDELRSLVARQEAAVREQERLEQRDRDHMAD